MSTIKGYLLNQKQREGLKKVDKESFFQTDEKIVFDKNLQKISMLLNLIKVTERVVFNDEEKQLFGGPIGIFYSKEEYQISDMKSYSKEVLLDQANVTLVSCWETYFSTILEKILNDDDFVKESLKKEKFKKFLQNFRLLPDFEQLVVLNMCNYNNLNFGKYIFEKKRVNCQSLDDVKDLFNLLLGYKINQDPKKWNKLHIIFDMRHKIVHGSNPTNNQMQISIEPSDITKSINYMYEVVSEIDKSFFSLYKNQ